MTTTANLTEAEDDLLADILRRRPDSKSAVIIELFRAATGRTISQATVSWRRRGLMKPRGSYHLTEAQRATLARICREAAPDYNRRQIQAMFELETGRSISYPRVSTFVREEVGAPKLVGARRGRDTSHGRIAERAAAIRAEGPPAPPRGWTKAPKDRSPRAGRVDPSVARTGE